MFKKKAPKEQELHPVMYGEDILDCFIENVTLHDKGFLINTEQGMLYFLQMKVGDARLIYATQPNKVADDSSTPLYRLEQLTRVAAAKKRSVYVLDEKFFGDAKTSKAYGPADIKKMTRQLFEDTMNELYDSTDPEPLRPGDEKTICAYEARRHLLEDKEFDKCDFCGSIAVSEEEFLEDLCGIRSMKNLIMDYYGDMAPHKKAVYLKVKELMRTPEAVLSMQDVQMHEALASCKAEYVRVSFKKFNKEDSVDCKPEIILERLAAEQPFTDHDFKSKAQGRMLFKNLDCDQHLRAIKPHDERPHNKKEVYPGWPSCDDIVCIKNDGQILYQA